jgi:very-short-patch-repair endonuclease
MSQPIKKDIKNPPKPKKKLTTKANRLKQIKAKRKGNNEYGTSKLEEKFARDFLEKLGVPYIYQYKAESIGRYFDFKLRDYPVFFEIDGTYYHGKGLLYEEMSPMQKKNHKVDKIKNDYCSRNGYLLIRLWEDDINKNPSMVMNYLKKILAPYIKNNV